MIDKKRMYKYHQENVLAIEEGIEHTLDNIKNGSVTTEHTVQTIPVTELTEEEIYTDISKFIISVTMEPMEVITAVQKLISLLKNNRDILLSRGANLPDIPDITTEHLATVHKVREDFIAGTVTSEEYSKYITEYSNLVTTALTCVEQYTGSYVKDAMRLNKNVQFYNMMNITLEKVLAEATINKGNIMNTIFDRHLVSGNEGFLEQNLNISNEAKSVNDKIFGKMTYNHGWKKTESITLFGKNHEVKITAAAYKNDEILPIQRTNYSNYKNKLEQNNDQIIKKLNEYAKKFLKNTKDLHKTMEPKGILFTREGPWGILAEIKEDVENGIGIFFNNNKITVDRQDALL